MDNWFLTKMSRQLNMKRLVILTKGAETTGYPYAKNNNNLDL